jgi:hypothetical protein
MANLTITQAASAITDLINSRSSSPRHDELVAIIAQTQGHSPLPDAHAARMEWRRLINADHAAVSVWGKFAPGGSHGRAGCCRCHRQGFAGVRATPVGSSSEMGGPATTR